MKRKFVDINVLASYTSLYNAFNKASVGKKGERKEVKMYEENLHNNLVSLSERLLNGTWTPAKGRTFKLRTEGKLRDIHTVGIEDRIVHHAINTNAFCHLRKTFILRTFGNIKKRGTLTASKQVRRDLRTGYNYVLQLDMRKYYPSINKPILKKMIAETIKGREVLSLINKIIDSYKPESETGVSIGALLSQDIGNFYLTPFDRFCQEELKVRYYTRYVDDVVMLFETKEEIARCLPLMLDFLSNYKIEAGTIEVYPITGRKIDFCGYQIDRGGARLRKRTAMRFRKRLNELDKHPKNIEYEEACVNSYMGFLKHCKSKNFIKQQRDEHYQVFSRIDRHAARRRREKTEFTRSTAGEDGIQNLFQSPPCGTRQ